MNRDERYRAIVLYLRKRQFSKTRDMIDNKSCMYVGDVNKLWSDLKRLEALGVINPTLIDGKDMMWELSAGAELAIWCVL